MNTAAITSGWPTREMALLIADPRPARSTGTEAISTVVNGATTSEIPAPNTMPARNGPRIVETGGTRGPGSVIEAGHGVEVGPTVSQIKVPAAMRIGPPTRNGRGPIRAASSPARAETKIRNSVPGSPTSADASGV